MKKEFRKKVIADRKAKDKDFIEKNSDIITEKLLQMDCIKIGRASCRERV